MIDLYVTIHLADGRVAAVHPLTFGRARLSVGAAGQPWYEDEW